MKESLNERKMLATERGTVLVRTLDALRTSAPEKEKEKEDGKKE